MAITVVQTKQAAGTTSPINITLDSSTTAGNCLVVAIATFAATTNPTISGITLGGAAGNFAALYAPGTTSDPMSVYFWADPNCAGGQTAVSVSYTAGTGGSTVAGATVWEVSGLVTSSLLDGSSYNLNASTGASFTSNSTATLAQSNEIAFGIVGDQTTGSTITGPSSPWNNSAQLDLGGTAEHSMAGYNILASTTGLAYSGTFSPNSSYSCGIITINGAATAAAAAAVPPAAPGQTWRRQFKHRQMPDPGPHTASASSAISGGGAVSGVFGGAALIEPGPGPARPGRTWKRAFQHRQKPPIADLPPPSFSGASSITGTGSLAAGGSKTGEGASAITGTGMASYLLPSVLQQVTGTSTYDYGLSTVAITTTAGTTLIVLAGWDLSTDATSAAMPAVNVTDSAGNYWYHAGTSSASVTGSRSAAWVCVNSRPITWVSVALSTFASSLAYTVLEVANMPAYFSPDVSAANAVASATSLSVAPGGAVSNDIAFSVLAAGGSGLTAPSTPSGWTALTAVTAGDGSANPVQIFPFWNSALSAGTAADITYTVGQAVPLSGVTFGMSVSPPVPLQPNPQFPRLKVEAAFGYTPGDPSQAPPQWTDITARCISKEGESFISSSMGRQYELAQMEAGELEFAIDNHDGAFTPGNTASPYYPGVVLGVPVRVSAYWDGHWYYVGYGWVERWPQEWPDLPQWGMSKMIATDAIAVLSAASMPSALAADILLDAPYTFIPAGEQYTTLIGGLNPTLIPADAQGLLAANSSRTNQRAAVYVDGTAATGDTGQQTGLLGDSGTGFGTSSISSAPVQPSSGPGIIYTDPELPGPTSADGVSVEFWVVIPDATAASLQPLVFSAYGPASNYGSARPSLTVRINSFSGATMTVTTAAGNTLSAPFNPGTDPQQIVLAITSSSLAVYLNGGLAGTLSLGASDTTAWSAVAAGCPNYAYQASLGEIGDFTVFDVAVYSYQLPVQRILSHYVTGFSGQQGSDATARMAQILSWANLGVARAGQVLFGDPGVMEDIAEGPAYSLAGQSAAEGINQLVLNESGQAFASPSGAVVFTHRWALFNQAAAATFGDSPDPAQDEVPYLPAMSWDYDLTYLYNQDTITQQVGANTTITVSANDFASQAAYFLRSALTQTIQTTSDLDAYSAASWQIAKYSQPELRVRGVTVDAASNSPVAFPVVLSLQQGQAVRAARRPVGGAEITELVVVQKIEHRIGPGLWQTSYQLSPYAPESNVLELDSSGYDVLGDNTLP